VNCGAFLSDGQLAENSSKGGLPAGWKTIPLGALADFAKGRKPKETRKDPVEGDVRLLLIESLQGGQGVFTSPESLVLAETRDTIMVMDGASSCDVAIGHCGAVGSTLGRFRPKRPDLFSPHALYRFFEARIEEFKSKNVGAAIPHANKDYILGQAVAVPPATTMASFHERLEPVQALIDVLRQRIQNLRRTRDFLLPKLFSAEMEHSRG